jgi:hypothetical protein
MNISLTSITKSLSNFFKRYHFIIFVVFIVGSASYVILLINNTVALSDESNGYTSKQNDSSFDEDTIKRLRELKGNDQETEKLPATGRVSPF